LTGEFGLDRYTRTEKIGALRGMTEATRIYRGDLLAEFRVRALLVSAFRPATVWFSTFRRLIAGTFDLIQTAAFVVMFLENGRWPIPLWWFFLSS